MHANLKALFYSAVSWTAIGLGSGLMYREVSKHFKVLDRSTQLGLVHAHTLVLGTVVFLLVLGLVRGLTMDAKATKQVKLFIVVWNVGLALTTGGLLVKGVLQMMGNAFAKSPMLAGISGLGHMTLTFGLVVMLLMLRPLMQPAQSAELEKVNA